MNDPTGLPVVDCHVHALPDDVMRAFRASLARSGDFSEGPPGLWSSEAFGSPSLQLEALDRQGIDTAIITFSSNAPAALHALATASGRGAAETVRAVNRELAGWAQQTAGRLLSTAWVDPRLGDDVPAEMERAVWDDGVVGFSTLCSFLPPGGSPAPSSGPRFLDDPAFDPVLERAAALGVPLFVHAGGKYELPAGQPPLELETLVLLKGAVSMLVETAVCVLRLLLAGSFERHPGLRVVFGQLGGLFPFLLGRVHLIESLVGGSGRGEDAGPTRATRDVMARLRDNGGGIFVDTHSMDGPAILAALEVLGERNVVFGSDFPITPEVAGRARALEGIEGLPVGAGTKARILAANAQALLPATTLAIRRNRPVGEPVGGGRP